MLMVNDGFCIGLVINYLLFWDVVDVIDKNVVKCKVEVMEEFFCVDFGIEWLIIVVLGFNLYVSDGGVIGLEEEVFICLVIVEFKKKGMMVFGLFLVDGFFGVGYYVKFDGILVMYYDQGLMLFKVFFFGNGVNYIVGLIYICIFLDYGMAYDFVGKDEVDLAFFWQVVYEVIDIVCNCK